MKLTLVRFAVVICLISASAADTLLNLGPLLELLLWSPPKPHWPGTCAITVGSKCVDVTDANSANGTPLQISTCMKTTPQQYTASGDGTIRVSGKCMQVKNGQTGNLAPVQLYDCNGSLAQQWVVLASGQLKNVHSNKCLLVKDGKILDNQPLVTYDCYTSKYANEAFATNCKRVEPCSCTPKPIHPKPCGFGSIKVGGKCVNVPGGNSDSSTQLDIATCNEIPAQNWTSPGDGTIRALGKCIDVRKGATASESAVQLYDCNGSPAQQWVYLPSGQLKNPQSNRCLDVHGGLGEGFKLVIQDCHETNLENQAFESTCLQKTFEPSPPPPTKPATIVPKNPQPRGSYSIKVGTKCINVPGGNSKSSTQLDVASCSKTAAQYWTIPGDGTIRALGKCMDVRKGATASFSAVQLYDCNGSPAQQWVFLSSGQLKNPQSNRCLDVEGGLGDGFTLIIYDCRASNFQNQAFKTSILPKTSEPPPPSPIVSPTPATIVPKNPQPSGTTSIKVSGKCINVPGGKSINWTQLDIASCKATPAQVWSVLGDGTIRALGKCVDVRRGGTAIATPVQLYDCNGTPAQQWVFLSSGQIKNPASNSCLDVQEDLAGSGFKLIIYDCHETILYNQVFDSSSLTGSAPLPPPNVPTDPPSTIVPKDPQPCGTSTIKSGGKCVNVPGGNSENWTQLNVATCDGTSAQQWTVPGDGSIRSLGKCMDVRRGGTAIATPVQLYDCNGTPAQQWVFLSSGQLKNPESNRCVDIQGGSNLIIYDCHETNTYNQAFESNYTPPPPPPPPIVPSNPQPSGICSIKVGGKCVDSGNSDSGTQLDVATCAGTSGQGWRVPGDGTIRVFGKCMDVRNGDTDNLTAVQLFDCNGTPGQQWVFLSSGQLRNLQSGRCLDVQGGIDGTNLIIYDCKQTDFENQAFESVCMPEPIEPTTPPPIVPSDPQPGGICTINVGGKCVVVPGDDSESGIQLGVATCDGAAGQYWSVPDDGTIRAFGMCMDVRDGGIDNLTAVQLLDCNGSPAQQWVFLTSGQLKNPQSDLCLDVEGGIDGTNLIIYDCKNSDFANQSFETICVRERTATI